MTPINTYNYIVPASGTTRGVVVSETLTATPILKDFRAIQLDGVPFIPSGVYIDNSRNSSDCEVVINEIGFRVFARAGQSIACQYPAPSNQTVSISGGGETTLVFVDYPLIPFIMGGENQFVTTTSDGGDTALGSTTDSLVTDPLADATLIALNKGILQSIQLLNAVQLDTAGNPLPASFDTLPRTLAYNVAGDLTSITVTAGASSYVQTFSYTGANLTGITGWVKQ